MLTGQCVDGPFSSAVPAGGMEFEVTGETGCTNTDPIAAQQTCEDECGSDKFCQSTDLSAITFPLTCDSEYFLVNTWEHNF